MIFSTNDVHPRERLAYWVEVATRGYVAHDFHPEDAGSFNGSVEIGVLGGTIGMARFRAGGGRVHRSERYASRSSTDDILLGMTYAGGVSVAQDGVESTIDGCGMFLVDSLRPFEIKLHTTCNNIALRIPRPLIEARLGTLAGRMAHAITETTGIEALAMGYLKLVSEKIDSLDELANLKAAEQLLDLLALAFTTGAGSAPSLSSARATALLRLKAIVERRLVEPDLKPERVAAEAGISVRYANALLGEEHTSIERYIAERRLERSRAALEDATQCHRNIGEIAFSWGFSDLSHFGRRFKARFGVTPTDYRRRAALIASRTAAGDAASPAAARPTNAAFTAENGLERPADLRRVTTHARRA